MPTYEYQCKGCGLRFEKQQAMTEEAVQRCPVCGADVQRLISGGAGFIVKGADPRPERTGGACSLETMGKTCCGRDERCGEAHCR